jgi:hypothetical protein
MSVTEANPAAELVLRSVDATSVMVDSGAKGAAVTAAKAGAWSTKSIALAAAAGLLVLAVGLGAGLGVKAASGNDAGGPSVAEGEQLLTKQGVLGTNFPYDWAPFTLPGLDFAPQYVDFAVSGLGKYVWVVASKGGRSAKSKIYHSWDYGVTFRHRDDLTLTAYAVAMDGYGSRIWIMALDGTMLVSDNWGSTFRQHTQIKDWPSLAEGAARSMRDIKASEDGKIVVVAGIYRVWISEDYGKDGSFFLRTEFRSTYFNEAPVYRDVAISRAGDFIVVSSTRLSPMVSVNGKVFVEIDQGRAKMGVGALGMSGDGKHWIISDGSWGFGNGKASYWSDDYGKTVKTIGGETIEASDAVCDYDATVCIVAPYNKGSKLLFTDGTKVDRPDAPCWWKSVGCSRYNGCQNVYLFCESGDTGKLLYRLEKQT